MTRISGLKFMSAKVFPLSWSTENLLLPSFWTQLRITVFKPVTYFIIIIIFLSVCFFFRVSSPLAQLYSTSTMEHHHFDHSIMILNSEVCPKKNPNILKFWENIFGKYNNNNHGNRCIYIYLIVIVTAFT